MAKPKLALIPAAQGDKFYSVLPSSGVGDFDFTRSGGATRINSQGLIETVGDGVSRLNYPLIDGKVVGCPSHLLEPQRTNLFTYSEDFSNWSNSQSTETINSGISPDGSNTATKVKPTNSSSTWAGLNSPSLSITSGTAYTFSVFAKKDEYSYIQVGGSTPRFNGSFSTIDLSNGTVVYESGINADVESYGNGWYKISFTQTAISSGSGLAGFIAVYNYAPNSRLQAFGGDGSSGILVWGCQFEQGSYGTSYIKSNSGSQTTRSAETANNSGDASTFNDSEGVLMVEFALQDGDNETRQFGLSNGSDNENVKILQLNSSTIRLECKMSLGVNFVKDVLISAENNNKFLIQYKANDYKVFVNGFKRVVNQRSTTPIGLNKINFDRGDGASDFYGNTKQIQYFDSALNDSDLEKLTSWVSFSDMANGQLYTIE